MNKKLLGIFIFGISILSASNSIAFLDTDFSDRFILLENEKIYVLYNMNNLPKKNIDKIKKVILKGIEEKICMDKVKSKEVKNGMVYKFIFIPKNKKSYALKIDHCN